MSDIRDYQVNHLLLLVGSNPVPNVVAGKLLTAPGSTITFIHSKDGSDLAQRLGEWFGSTGYTDIRFAEVKESNATSVHKEVSKKIEEYERNHAGTNQTHTARMGLNYTGGTKVMAVHAYRALEQWASKPNREAVFSYLDAHTLQMLIERTDDMPPIPFDVGLEVEISIRDLLKLHNWELRKDSPIAVPVLPESAAALLAIHNNITDADIWAGWLRNELFRHARKPGAIDTPFWVFQAGKELEGQFEVKQSKFDSKWRSNTDLGKLALSWPDLPTFREAMSNEFGQHNTNHLNLTAARGRGCKKEEDFCQWLSGTWLESAVLAALQQCAQELQLKECYMDIKLKVPVKKAGDTETHAPGQKAGKTEFQFDVVAIRGYQLFAFSCSTESARKGGGRGLLKQKLFEAYVRAQQMGGDEACVALVCCMEQEEADKLQEEMRRDISPEGRIRVFGRERLKDLTGYIADWIRQQSKEG
jgi:hypothetical protein